MRAPAQTGLQQGLGRGIGDGIVDFAGLVRYLEDRGYDGYLSLETHYQRDGSSALATRDCVAALRSIA